MRTRRKLIVGAIAAAAFAASTAYADPQGGPRDGARGPGGHHHMHHGHGGGFTNPMARVEGRLAATKVELKITPAQESAWKTFADKVRGQATAMQARFEKTKGQPQAAPLPAPEQLARRTEFAKQRLAGMETMTAAVKDLYGVLDAEQKKTADRLLAQGPGGGFRGGHGGHGGRQGPGEQGGRSVRG